MKGFLLVCLLLLHNLCIGQQLNVPKVDNSSYEGKVMFGYQGWFAHPDDNSARPVWWHWGNLFEISTEKLNVEMYPDMREHVADERYSTAYMLPNGAPAPVFSSGNKSTVVRHMKWVRDYNVDGVFVQRFINEQGDKVVMKFRDDVTSAGKEGCDQYGRVFAIMYDGIGHDDVVEHIKNDWMHLIDDVGILGSSYLNHKGRPLVALWGFTFYDGATVNKLIELIDWFHNKAPQKYRASIKLGVNDNWFKKSPDWLNAFDDVEVISPWSVGRYSKQEGYNNYLNNQFNPGKSWCDARGILYVPVIFPGFSWYNRYNGTKPKNEIPRNGGNFYWLQSYGAIQSGAKSIYIAMLDELDESTAMFKTAENASMAPAQGYWLNLDADGYKLPSDWYLRCAGKTAEVLRGHIGNSSNLGTPPEGIMTIRPLDKCQSLVFNFPDFKNESTIKISLDGGNSYPYSTNDNVGSYAISGLSPGVYNVYVKHPNKPAVPMGNVGLFASSGEGSCFVPGAVYEIKSVHSNKYLDVEGVSTANGANVHQWERTGGANQRWLIKSVVGGYVLKAMHSNYCLDVAGKSTSLGGNIQQWSCSGANNQKWKVTEVGNGEYKIESVHSGYVLDVAGFSNDNGGNIQQWSWSGANNQRWKLIYVGENIARVASVRDGAREFKKALEVYPVPASDYITLHSEKGIKEISVRSVLGREINNTKDLGNSTSIDLSKQKPGMYILQVQYVDGTGETRKFMKK